MSDNMSINDQLFQKNCLSSSMSELYSKNSERYSIRTFCLAFSICFLIQLLHHVQFAAKICLLTSFRDTCFIEIVPQSQTPKRGKLRNMIMDTRDKYEDVETCHFI